MQRSEIADAPSNSSIPERTAYPVPEVAKLLGGVNERYVWTLISTGELPSFKVGRRRLVADIDISAFVERLRADDDKARAAASAR